MQRIFVIFFEILYCDWKRQSSVCRRCQVPRDHLCQEASRWVSTWIGDRRSVTRTSKLCVGVIFTVRSSNFYINVIFTVSVSRITVHTVKCTGTHRNFSTANVNDPNAVYCVQLYRHRFFAIFLCSHANAIQYRRE